MIHNGFAYLEYKFPNPYLTINNKLVKVEEQCFHAAVLFSKVQSPDLKFTENFWKSFQKLLPYKYQRVQMTSINFQKLSSYTLNCSKVNGNFGYVIVKGKRYKLNNYIVEPLHIFKGRGDHPQRGTIKFTVMPEQITLNVSKTPPCPLSGHTWGNVINNENIQWAGFYKDNFGQTKYMYPILNDECKKFDNARVLKKKLHNIRKNITQDLDSNKERLQQKATAAYLIDKLCIRIGHPKESDSADTVGCCTLRVEHIKIGKNSISFEFLGKDSIEFKKTLCPHESVMRNMKSLVKNKQPCESIFHSIDANSLNTYLNKLCTGLTAKQFRTCHASDKFSQLLSAYNPAIDGNILKYYKICNAKVAKLCNHKRGDSLSNETSKANYIDPRIVFAFSKKHNIPLQSLYSSSLLQRHSWAKDASPDFKF